MRAFTKMELLFIAAFQGDATAAARVAGYKFPNRLGSRLMQRPEIKAAVDAKQRAMVTEAGKDLGRTFRKVGITRNDIINGLADIARKGKSESARVAAYSKLADVFRLSPKNSNDDPFSGWTEEELREFAASGNYPARFRQELGPGDGAEETPRDPARKAN